MNEIFFMSEQSIFLQAGMLSSIYYIKTNEIYHFTTIFLVDFLETTLKKTK